MNEHGSPNATCGTAEAEPLVVVDPERAGDLVFDVTDMGVLDFSGLSMMLTARQMAHDEDRKVWVAGLSKRAWTILEALGLEGYFDPFPSSSEIRAA